MHVRNDGDLSCSNKPDGGDPTKLPVGLYFYNFFSWGMKSFIIGVMCQISSLCHFPMHALSLLTLCFVVYWRSLDRYHRRHIIGGACFGAQIVQMQMFLPIARQLRPPCMKINGIMLKTDVQILRLDSTLTDITTSHHDTTPLLHMGYLVVSTLPFRYNQFRSQCFLLA